MTRQDPQFVFDPANPRPVAAPEEAPVDPQGGLVPTWSYSALKSFEECAYRVYLSRVEKHTEEKTEALLRGTEIHSLAEQFVRGDIEELPKPLARYGSEFRALRELFAQGKVTVEEDWGFDIDWNPIGWFDDGVWGRMKLDAFVREDETSARLIDFKTGKKFGNEITHMGQAQLYAVAAFMRFPEIEFIDTEFWYLDQDDPIFKKTYTRTHAMLFLPSINKRAIAMTSEREFRPSPSKAHCKWCPHAKTDVCKWADK